jgi:DNA-binding response OmpR family regulator
MPQGTEPLAREAQEATKTILVVEDDLAIASFLVAAIEQETPYRAVMATDSHAALELVRHFIPNLLLLDYRLPGMNGIELYDRLKEVAPIPAILMTASRQLPQEQIQQRQLIAFRKPFELDVFLATIETLLTSP